MSTDSASRSQDKSDTKTRDISVLQLLTRLVVETERLIKLADDINQHATTPQAKAAMNLIGSEVSNILNAMKTSIDPLYNLYDIDAGLKEVKSQTGSSERPAGAPVRENKNEYDEDALWGDVKKNP